MLWIDGERTFKNEQAIAAARVNELPLEKRAPSTRFVDVRLKPGEAIEILKALGGNIRDGAGNTEIAGQIAAQANLLLIRKGR